MSRLFLAGTVLALLLPLAPFAGAAEPFYVINHSIPSQHDGMPIAVTLYEPRSVCPCPAIVMTHGWAGKRGDMDGLAREYAADGYYVLTYDSRGWAGSAAPRNFHPGGVVTLNGPKEVADVQSLVRWLGLNPLVQKDGVADPRVGMRGVSYAGGIQLLAAEADDRIDTIVPEITWHDLRTSLFPAGVVKEGYVNLLFAAGEAYPYGGGVMHPDLARWYADARNPASDHAEVLEELRIRSAVANPAELDLPVFIVHGLDDPLFTPNEAVANYEAVRDAGGQARLLFVPGGHGWSSPHSSAKVNADVAAWFDCYLRNDCSANVTGDGTVEVHVSDTDTRKFAGLPSVGDLNYSVAYDLPRIIVPSVAPTSHTAFHQFESSSPVPSFDARTSAATIRFLDFMGPEGKRITGTPTVTIDHQTGPLGASAYVKLVDYAPDSSFRVVHDMVMPVRLAPGINVQTVELEFTDWNFTAGHTVGVVIALSDTMYQAKAGSSVAIRSVTLGMA